MLFPYAPTKTESVDCFRRLSPEVTMYTVVQKCGRPDEEVGSGLYIFLWHMKDGSTVGVGGLFNLNQAVGDIKHTSPSGKTTSLLKDK